MLDSGMFLWTLKYEHNEKQRRIFTRAKNEEQALDLFKENFEDAPEVTITLTTLQDFLDIVNESWEDGDEFEFIPVDVQ